MGMMAVYMEAESDLIDNFRKKSYVDLFKEIEIYEEQDIKAYEMDKLWDGLHYILTGVSAAMPIEDNLLSEAIVGTDTFIHDESADYLAYIYPERVSEILSAFNEFDINKALSDFSPKKLAKEDIYPSIWEEDDKDELKEELIEVFEGYKEFLHTMSTEHKGIIVSIY